MDKIILSIAASCWLCGNIAISASSSKDQLMPNLLKWLTQIVIVFGTILWM